MTIQNTINARLYREELKSAQMVHLQGRGRCPAIPAGEVRIGDTLVWNYGSTSEVVAVERKGKQVIVRERWESAMLPGTFQEGDRRMSATRLVGIFQK